MNFNSKQLNDIKYRLSQILSLIITFRTQIQSVKQKLIQYPEFNPQSAFFLIDIKQKGYITVTDVYFFLEQKIEEKFILVWLNKHNKKNQISYLEFLNLLKPMFNSQLTEDLFRRNNKLQLNQILQSIFAEFIFLEAVLTSELQILKQELCELYCLNHIEIKYHLPKQTTDTALFKFITQNGFEIEIENIKFLKTFLNKFDLLDELSIKNCFLPCLPLQNMKLNKTKSDNRDNKLQENNNTLTLKHNFLDFRMRKQNTSRQNFNYQQLNKEFTEQLQDHKSYNKSFSYPKKDKEILKHQDVFQNLQSNLPILDNFIFNRKYPQKQQKKKQMKKNILDASSISHISDKELGLDIKKSTQVIKKSRKMESFDINQFSKINPINQDDHLRVIKNQTVKPSDRSIHAPPHSKHYQQSRVLVQTKRQGQFLIDNFLKKKGGMKKEQFNDSLLTSKKSEAQVPFQYY